MIKRDYYEVLGISRNASDSEIKTKYRKIALECHPDRCGGDKEKEESFKQASEAYEVLSDPQKRRAYDIGGHAGLAGTGFHGFDDVNDIFSSFGNIFEDFFGFAGGGRNRASRGSDIGHELNITFDEAMKGVEKEIEIEKMIRCEDCHGSGIPLDAHGKNCTTCHGSGQVTVRQGFFVLKTTCPHCGGRGNTAKCSSCHGQGMKKAKRKLSVKVPKGVDDQMRLVLRGEGNPSHNNGPAGDLYVIVNVAKDDRFERQGDDLFIVKNIPFSSAALGCKILIPTLDADEELKIHSGIQSGEDVRLKGKGAPRLHHKGHGDLIVKVIVETPKKLNNHQRKLLEELAKEGL